MALGWLLRLFSGGGGQPGREEIARLYEVLESAGSYAEWYEAAERLDELEGSNAWKSNPQSPHYDSNLIQMRITELRRLESELLASDSADSDDAARIKDRFEAAIFRMRVSCVVRNFGGCGTEALYLQTHVGTKSLIEEHQALLIRLLHIIVDDEYLSLEQRLNFFSECRHALGKTALVLSGGATLGMYHLGVIKALHEQGLMPRIISGSSAGAMVAAFVCTRTNEQLTELFKGDKPISAAIRLDFFDPVGSLERKLRRIIRTGHLMDVHKFQNALAANLGDVTFHEAFATTGLILNIGVSPGIEKPRLLNYLTAPNVLVWSAAAASCALPGLYEAVELVAKNDYGEKVPYHLNNAKWTDISLSDLDTTNRLQELFNVNYLIVSQTNPHAVPFVQQAQRQLAKTPVHRSKPGIMSRAAASALFLIRSEIMHRCDQAIRLGLVPKLLAMTLNQKYVGDVTIVPPLSFAGYKKMISNPTAEALDDFVRTGEVRTWPNISLLKGQCGIEIVLDQCVRKLVMRSREIAQAAAAGDGKVPDLEDGGLDFQNTLRHTHLDLNQVRSCFNFVISPTRDILNGALFQFFNAAIEEEGGMNGSPKVVAGGALASER